MHSDPAAGAPLTVLAFDFGLKRIGIAVGDTITSTAAPRPAIPFGNWTAIEREVRSLQPQFLVVGAPYNANGSEGAIAPRALSRRSSNAVSGFQCISWTSAFPRSRRTQHSKTDVPVAHDGGECDAKTSTVRQRR
jgi:hypothetical protein